MKVNGLLLIFIQPIRTTSFITPFTHCLHASISQSRDAGLSDARDVRFINNDDVTSLTYARSIRSKKDDSDDEPSPNNASSNSEKNSRERNDSLDKSNVDWSPFTSRDQNGNGPNLFALPPFQIDITNILFYDVFLLLNLSVSISFFAIHRTSLQYITPAFSEGALFCILWIVSGLYYGTFLYSSVTGHYDADQMEEKNIQGPVAAGTLALSTFITTSSLRIIVSLAAAWLEHRPVGVAPGEDLIPLEIGFGLILMSIWRYVWSSYTQY